MSIVPLNLPARSNPSRFGFEGNARLINCYSEPLGPDAKSQSAIYAAEGLDTYLSVSNSGGIKCFMPTEEYLYGVAGADVFAIDVNLAVTILETLPVDGDAYMARNRRDPTTQVGLVANDQYRSIEGVTIGLVTTNLLAPPTSIDARDGYLLMTMNFGRYQKTAEDDSETLSLTDFGKAQRAPDTLLRVMATETDIILFGTESMEWHSNQPNALGAFPFVPVAHKNLGLIGRNAAVRLEDTVLFVGNDGTVRIVSGYDSRIISHLPVQRDIGRVTDKNTIVMTAWNSLTTGHKFMSMSCDLWTWQYDLTTGEWFERKSTGLDRWRVSQVCVWNGVTIAGDYATGELYVINGDLTTDAGDPIQMTVQTAPTEAGPYPLTVNALYIEHVPGTGRYDLDTESEDPQMVITWSDDGGRNWATERSLPMGKAGETYTAIETKRLGQIKRNGRTWRMQCSASVARCITAAYLDVEKDQARGGT
jgi:hypothetical protein